MKLITAVVKPFKLDDVKDALKAAGAQGITVSEVRGFGRQGGHTETYRGTARALGDHRAVLMRAHGAAITGEGVVEAIAGAANTDKIGDGKVWVTSVDSLVRIRTGETGSAAI